MKVAVCICAYNEARFIGPWMRQLPKWIDKILLLSSDKPWNGPDSDKRHETWERAQALGDPRLEVIRGRWKDETNQRNWGLGRLAEYDWVLIFDADEFLDREDWQVLARTLENAPKNCPVIRAPFQTYWKDFDHVLDPPDTPLGTIAIRPKLTSFVDKRGPYLDVERRARILVHHLSWVRSDEEVFQKIQNWSHTNDFDWRAWFANVWKPWKHGMKNIHPYSKILQTTRISPLPESIRTYFN